MERYKTGVKTNNPDPLEFKFNAPVSKKSIFKGLQSISELDQIILLEKSLIKESYPKSLKDIFLCESFYKFTNTLIPTKFPSLDGDHPRLLIPFRDEQGEIFAYQGRAFGNEQPKYITIKLRRR